jgi:hypothetical protein
MAFHCPDVASEIKIRRYVMAGFFIKKSHSGFPEWLDI